MYEVKKDFDVDLTSAIQYFENETVFWVHPDKIDLGRLQSISKSLTTVIMPYSVPVTRSSLKELSNILNFLKYFRTLKYQLNASTLDALSGACNYSFKLVKLTGGIIVHSDTFLIDFFELLLTVTTGEIYFMPTPMFFYSTKQQEQLL